MAMVFRAKDLMLERTVAIKLLRTDYSRDDAFRERFRQEAKAAASLSHPNIVTVYDFGLDSDRLYLIMEFVPGTDLKSLIQQNGRFSIESGLSLMVQACAGIGYAHRAGLVHCDIKPQNLLVTPDNRLKVLDFGIARALASISPEEQAEVVWGSPQYFSPEQAAGFPPSPASDIYSLGVVMYEMLTGRLPFLASTPEELARAHRDDLVPSPRRFNPNIPPELEQAMLKVLSKEPAARYRAADQFGRVLVTIAEQYAIPLAIGPIHPASEATPDAAPTRANPGAYYSPAPAAYPPAAPPAPIPASALRPPASPLDFDWVTWVLVLVAVLAVGGLIPFCLWVYTILNPPI
jgi:serine/threonine-protein kinase